MFKYIFALFLTLFVVSCAQDMGTIDRTQPGRVDKSMFKIQDEWFMVQTVIDVPFSTGFSFIGEQTDAELVRWRITEDKLFAHRAHDWIDGSEEFLLEDGEYYFGAPVAIYAIQSHFDVQKQYNPQTGEETNVIEENTSDRPWYERKYMRIDWSQNLVQDFRFGSPSQIPVNPVAYYVQDTETESKEKPIISENYMDIVGAIFAEPETFDWDGEKYPSCYLYSGIHKDCMGQRIKIRSSFLKKDTTDDYVAEQYDDNKFNKFGYFRTDRWKYDRWRGYSSNEEIHLINKWNIWAKGEMSKPVAERKTRKIVYYLNDTYPDDTELKLEARKVVCTWNRILKSTVAVMQGKTVDLNQEKLTNLDDACSPYLPEIDDIIVLCENNPVVEEDSDYCGEVGLNPQLGDMRYNFINWIANPQEASPLGYGPTTKNSETGQILNATANVYGNELETYVTYVMDIIDLLNGVVSLEDFTSGKYLIDYVNNMEINVSPSTTPSKVANIVNKNFNHKYKAISSYFKTGDFSNVESLTSKLERMKNTPIENLLFNEHLKQTLAKHFTDKDGNVMEGFNSVSPIDILSPKRLEKYRELEKILAKKTIMLGSFLDDTMMSMAKRYKDTPRAEVLKKIRNEIFYAVTLHEFGHTVGLRHNFHSAADAFNFFDEYWDMKFAQADTDTDAERGKRLQPEYIRHPNVADLESGLREYQYTSIMDYLFKPNSDFQGAGVYDYAAIHFGYGNQIMVFDGEGYNNDFYSKVKSGEYHYTQLPYLLKTAFNPNSTPSSDIKNAMRARKWVQLPTIENKACYKDADCTDGVCSNKGFCVECNSNTDCTNGFCSDTNVCLANVEVPIGFCSDEVVGDSWYCYRFSEGADFYEKMKAKNDYYENYYFFRNFKRGLALFGYGSFETYIGRLYRIFNEAMNQFRYSVYESYIKRTDEAFINDPTKGQHFAIGQMIVLNLFGHAMEPIEPGLYKWDAAQNLYINEEKVVDFSKFEEPGNELTPNQILVKPGIGIKYENDLYDGSMGYYYFDKPVLWGILYDKIFALWFSGDSWFSPAGVDGSANFNKYAINLYTLFPSEIQKFMGSVYAQDYPTYSSYLVTNTDGSKTVKSRDLIFMSEEDEAEYIAADKRFFEVTQMITFPQYAGWAIAGLYTSTWLSSSLRDSSRIGVVGSTDDYQPDWASLTEDVDYIKVTDPKTRKTYFAMKTNFYGNPETPEYNVGWKLIEDAKALITEFTGTDSEWQIDSKFDDMNVLRALYHHYMYY